MSNVVNEVISGNYSVKDGKQSFTKLEHRNQQIIHELATCLPFVKISPGKYFIGTEIRNVQIMGRSVLVIFPSGNKMYLPEFLLHYAKSESLRIGLNILKQNKTYQQVVVALLKKQPNTANAQKVFAKRYPSGVIDKQFNELVQEVRLVEVKLAEKRQNNSSIMTHKALN